MKNRFGRICKLRRARGVSDIEVGKSIEAYWKENTMNVVQIICAIFIPPLAVYLKQEKIDKDFWINLVLTLLCGIPGVVHALWIVLKD